MLRFAWILLLTVTANAVEGPWVQLYKARKFTEAERALRASLKQRPQDQQQRLYLARTLIELKRIPEALMEVQRILDSKPTPDTEMDAGKLLRQLAEQRFRDLSQSGAGQAGIHEIAGRRLEREGNFEAALSRYRQAQQLEATRPGLSYSIGSALWKMRDYEAAEKYLRTELERTPEHGMANFRLGQLLISTSREAEAVTPLERAAAALPDRWEVRRELGKAYRKTGKAVEARKVWESVAAARPDDDQVHFLLANLYRELGESKLAEGEFIRHRTLLEQRRQRSERR